MFAPRMRLARPLARLSVLPRRLPTRLALSRPFSSAPYIPADVVPLSEAHKAAVQATAPILAEHGVAITSLMYKNMLRDNPELRNIFSDTAQKSGRQPRALAESVYGYAANIHDLTPLLPTVVRIAEKHAVLGVKPEHYATVGTNLLGAITGVLGDAFTPELKEAWYNAYWQLARIFIEAEAGLNARGAWKGWKQFEVRKRTLEGDRMLSLELVPVDKSMLPLQPHKAGQFITVRAWIEELHCFQNRHYSLSDAHHGDHYRITVKLEKGERLPDGLLSHYIHSIPEGWMVDCAYPVGSFVLPETLPENIVLLSAGVGITPNLAMLNELSEAGPKISWIQGVRGPAEHVFKKHVGDLVAKSDGRIRSAVYYSRGGADGEGVQNGRITVDNVDPALLALEDKEALYYVCGPDSFMRDVTAALLKRGVAPERIHVEAFHAGEV